jgi:hypothetical protein
MIIYLLSGVDGTVLVTFPVVATGAVRGHTLSSSHFFIRKIKKGSRYSFAANLPDDVQCTRRAPSMAVLARQANYYYQPLLIY